MSSRDALCLLRGGRPIRELPLVDRPVEIGSAPSCDITLHGAGIAPRALLVHPVGGTVHVYDLVQSPGLRARSHMPLGVLWGVGADYAVRRTKAGRPAPDATKTEVLPPRSACSAKLALVRGAGADARSFPIDRRPLSLGAAKDNGIVLDDRAVSRHHCRIEPSPSGVRVRDLGSTNGTWVDGARVERQHLRPGMSLRLGRTKLRLVARGGGASGDSHMVVVSAPMLSVVAEAERLAKLSWPVLILGETGVGKEHVARLLHERGPRRREPFVALNAGGLPRDLVESELFGHERGAFTGAARVHRGVFEQAQGGTLFMDEVAELPVDLQARLLRVIETWRVRRIGGEREQAVDVRLVCATHADLRARVREERFRADLFYRIHRLVLEIPPLRARRHDIEPLVEFFIAGMASDIGARHLSEGALERLRCHSWPGNVRELRNVLELAAFESDERCIDAGAIERSLRRVGEGVLVEPTPDELHETLAHYGGNVSAAARALGLPRSTLRDRLKPR